MKNTLQKLNLRTLRIDLPILLFIIAIPIIIFAPLGITDFTANTIISIFMWAAIAGAANILIGYAGQVCFIPPLFIGVGAYVSTYLLLNQNLSPWLGMFVAASVAMALSLGIGFLFFRYGLRDVYFALGTMALVLIAQFFFLNLQGWGRSEGMYIIVRETEPWMMKFRAKLPYMNIAMFFSLGIILLSNWISKNKLGYWLRAIRENQEAAEAVGVNVMKYKMIAIAITAFALGIMGTFWANFLTFFDPYSAFHWELAGLSIIIIVAGGAGTVWGPFIGAAILIPMTEYVRARLGHIYPGLHMVVYGAALMIVLLYLPDGLIQVFHWIIKFFTSARDKLSKKSIVQSEHVDGELLEGYKRDSFKDLFAYAADVADHVEGGSEDNGKIVLEVNNLTRLFGGLRAVDDLTFSVKSGEIFGIIGPNGAGKTTTFNMIAGTLKPTEGSIVYKGEEIGGLLPHAVCNKGVARTFQITQSFPKLTALETVMVGAFLRYKNAEDAKKRAMDILEVVGLIERANILTVNLTLAELKRLEIAKALATDPDVVLLDEVIAGLTDVETAQVTDLIKKINQETGITFVVIEHVMKAIMELCDRVLVLNFGQQIAKGTPGEVTSDPIVIDAYLGQKLEYDNA